MKQAERSNLVAIILSVILCYITYLVVIDQLPQMYADYHGHVHTFLPKFTSNWWEGWLALPYCMWHMIVLGIHNVLYVPLADASAWTSCLFALFSFYVIYWMILKYTAAAGKEENTMTAGLIAFGFSVVGPLYISWLDAGDRFLGAYSMNPVHNPTQMCVLPFSLLCFCLVYDILNKLQNNDYAGVFFDVTKGVKKPFIYLAILLYLSTWAKPTFAEMFIPAVGILMFVEWIGRIRKKDGSASPYFKNCLYMLLCAVPALINILVQSLAFFVFGGSSAEEGGVIFTKWLEVWSMYTENVILSIVTGMAFPLLILLINAGFFIKDNMGRLALTGYAVGFLEAAVLGEDGIRLSHGNFMWPMISAMLLVWMTATLRLLVLEKTQNDTKLKRGLINAAWFLFYLHVLFGLLYMKYLIER